MRQEWSTEDLIGSWTLVGTDWQLVKNKPGATRLGFGLLLKFFELEGRFPRGVDEVPAAAVSYMGEQLKVDAVEFAAYPWEGRSVKYHREQIRDAFEFREFSVGDEDELTGWMAAEVCPVELRDEQLREALLVRCRSERIEPPTRGRIDRLIGSARFTFERQFCERTLARLSESSIDRLNELVAVGAAPLASGRGLLAELKSDPGKVSLETLLREVDKLAAVRALALPADLFSGASEKLVDGWRARAARSFPSDLRDTPREIRLTLLAALCWVRSSEITDALVDLLIELVHKINTRADRRVEKELTADLKRVRGKEGILFRLAEVAVEHPDDVVRDVLYPVVGEKTLRELVREAKADQQVFQARVRTVLRSSYSNHYRRMLPPLLAALDFRCNNTAYRPVMIALELLQRYAGVDGKVRFYDRNALVPLDGVVPKAWWEAVVDEKDRIERIPYELCVLLALRDAIRRREVYIDGANRWRNPEDDLPGDFDTAREVHYAAIRQPLDPTEFITGLEQRMAATLERLDQGLADGSTGGVRVTSRKGESWFSVQKLDKLPEPENLDKIKAEVTRRWGTLDLLDVLKDADFLTEFTTEFTSVASREALDRDTLRRRLLLDLFALGTNMGIRQIVNTGEHSESEAALRHVRRHFITRDNLRRAIAKLVNATFAARDPHWWGTGTSCASDSKKFGSWESNLMTQYHQRYGGHGGDDLLARRTQERLHLLSAEIVLQFGGRGHDRRAAAALHRRRDRIQLR
ncbi:Tn3 family transposase [Nocardia gipuzkoensis]|uniref:Tn3 family transposase n=1 Tax=Nocardia gipuzkoensis TaxID=2749991 RepID=UPI00237E4DCB|nr:Tn3 family transposase [Nocardia gipuzkoensis]MDE1675218.1 Tn3 family transposase [Nocardia gipuzkoensis]